MGREDEDGWAMIAQHRRSNPLDLLSSIFLLFICWLLPGLVIIMVCCRGRMGCIGCIHIYVYHLHIRYEGDGSIAKVLT